MKPIDRPLLKIALIIFASLQIVSLQISQANAESSRTDYSDLGCTWLMGMPLVRYFNGIDLSEGGLKYIEQHNAVLAYELGVTAKSTDVCFSPQSIKSKFLPSECKSDLFCQRDQFMFFDLKLLSGLPAPDKGTEFIKSILYRYMNGNDDIAIELAPILARISIGKGTDLDKVQLKKRLLESGGPIPSDPELFSAYLVPLNLLRLSTSTDEKTVAAYLLRGLGLDPILQVRKTGEALLGIDPKQFQSLFQDALENAFAPIPPAKASTSTDLLLMAINDPDLDAERLYLRLLPNVGYYNGWKTLDLIIKREGGFDSSKLYNGTTPLGQTIQYRAFLNRKVIIEGLIASSTDINIKVKSNLETELAWLAHESCKKYIHYYFDAYLSPLANAVQSNDLEAIGLLLQSPYTNVNATDRHESFEQKSLSLKLTPLHLASWLGKTEAVNLLIADPRTDLSAKAIEPGTPVDASPPTLVSALDIARKRGHTAIVRLLEQKKIK